MARAGGERLAHLAGVLEKASLVALDSAAMERVAAAKGPVVVERFPIRPDRQVDLEVERFRVTVPSARFVVGGAGGRDRPLNFDPESVVLLRGRVSGLPASHVFLGLSPHGSNGFIDLGGGQGKYWVSSRGPGGAAMPAGMLTVFRATAGGGLLPGVPMCGVSGEPWQPPSAAASQPILGLRQIELAIETDYEFFSLFGDLDAAGAYVVQLYGAVSDIYMRDVNARVDLTFVRLWDDPDDLFNDPDPLAPFRNYWNANMQWVHRDVAQFLTGRRNLAAGGVAYLGGLCNSNSYSWAGYALGFFADPDAPHVYNRDIMIAAHELGHNCNTPHTHDLGLDTCNDEKSQPRRGTIMSYCGQTFTGGDANQELRFHAVVQKIMEAYINNRPCIATDCNGNGIADDLDILSGFSPDVNGNGIPDECEDCNGNGILDGQDIASGFSKDLNKNGIPDECEPDCNGNGIPDDFDLAGGFSKVHFHDDFETDKGWTMQNLGATSGDWERGIPVNDPNWAYDPASDSDGSGRCFLTENQLGNTDVDDGATRLNSPQLDMSAGNLAIRYDYFLRLTNSNGADRILVEGSDNDGAGPWQTLAVHSQDKGLSWTTHLISPQAFAGAGLRQTDKVRLRFTINDANPQSIVEGGLDAFFIGEYIAPVSKDEDFNNIPDECQPDCDGNGVMDYLQIQQNMALDLNRNMILDSCEDCDGDRTLDLAALDHSHNILLAGLDHTRIREYLALLGTFIGASDDGALQQAQDLIITPDRRILVSSKLDHRIVEFDIDGKLIGDLVPPGSGGLSGPGAMLLTGSGSLLVASGGTGSILEYDLTTGAPMGAFISPGSGGLSGPFGLARGPGGDLFVTSADNQVLRYDGQTGAFKSVFVKASDNGGLNTPRGMLFLPDPYHNLLIASYGTNKVLEYDAASGAFIRQFSQVGTATVMTLDQPWCIRLGPDGGVYVSRAHDKESGGGDPLHLSNARIYHFHPASGFFIRSYIMGVDSGVQNPTGFDFVPDAGTDCNNNQVPDNCDIASGFSQDVNKNGIPDECEEACYADCDNSGSLNIDDFLCFQLSFAIADPYADCDGNRVLNIEDFICFQLAFALGCP